MANAIQISGDISAASAALAGLLLVFLGSISTTFDSYTAQEKNTVRTRYQQRGWFAFGGFALAIAATAFALLGEWQQLAWAAVAAIIFFVLALIGTLIAALRSVLEIK